MKCIAIFPSALVNRAVLESNLIPKFADFIYVDCITILLHTMCIYYLIKRKCLLGARGLQLIFFFLFFFSVRSTRKTEAILYVILILLRYFIYAYAEIIFRYANRTTTIMTTKTAWNNM